VEWMFCTPATNVVRLARESMQHNATFPNAKAPLLGRTKLQFVESANKPFRPIGVSLNTNVLYILWNVMRNERRLRQADQVGSRLKGAAKCGGKKSRTP